MDWLDAEHKISNFRFLHFKKVKIFSMSSLSLIIVPFDRKLSDESTSFIQKWKAFSHGINYPYEAVEISTWKYHLYDAM